MVGSSRAAVGRGAGPRQPRRGQTGRAAAPGTPAVYDYYSGSQRRAAARPAPVLPASRTGPRQRGVTDGQVRHTVGL